MDSRQIKAELERTLRKLRAGLITAEQARHEQSLLRDMLRAIEQVELEERMARIEQLLQAQGK
jgi:hypothetical protein